MEPNPNSKLVIRSATGVQFGPFDYGPLANASRETLEREASALALDSGISHWVEAVTPEAIEECDEK